MKKMFAAGAMLAVSVIGAGELKPEFTKAFTKQEFARRRDNVCVAIGPKALAILKGNEGMPGYVTFRQGNDFFYLSGVEAPSAILVLDGATRAAILFLPPRNEKREQAEGPLLVPGDYAQQVTGIPQVNSTQDFTTAVHRLLDSHEVIFTPMAPQELEAMSRDLAVRYNLEREDDPWDGRSSREVHFVTLLRDRFPNITVRDLSPELDRLRMMKSAEEISVIRKSSEIAAATLSEAMRSTMPGQYEYELNALGRFIHLRNGAQGAAYYALVASGEDAYVPHYHAGLRQMQDGDFLLMDFAPDYHYYQSDVTRMWPVNGKFSREQRELYEFYLKCYQSIIRHIRPNVTPKLVGQEAVADMEKILQETVFSTDEHLRAARKFVQDYRTKTSGSAPFQLGHFVGMSTHDVGGVPEVLRPGMVFTIEPALTVPEERIYIRLEDMLLVTEKGVENMSAAAPVETDAIETTMKQKGILKEYPRILSEYSVVSK